MGKDLKGQIKGMSWNFLEEFLAKTSSLRATRVAKEICVP
jgi:hypothetical protein